MCSNRVRLTSAFGSAACGDVAAGGRVRVWVRKHPVAAFIAVAYAFTFGVRTPLAAARAGVWDYPAPQALQFIGDYGPAVAAVTVAVTVAGPEGLSQLSRRLTHWRVPAGWYLAAIVGPLLLFLAAAGVAAVLTGTPFPDLGEVGRWPELQGWSRAATWLLLAATIGLGEELGWRGFAQPELQRRHTALYASVAIGVAWVFWHAPTFVFDEHFSDWSMATSVGWAGLLIVGSVLFGAVYNATDGSVPVLIVMHATQDFTMGSTAAQEPTLGVVWAILFSFVTALVVIRLGNRAAGTAGGGHW